MKISIYGQYYLPYITELLKEEGHEVLLNNFATDIDVCILESRFYMYEIYRKLKIIKKNNIKLINSVLDIPPWLIDKNNELNTYLKYIKQVLFNQFHKNPFLYRYTEKFRFDPLKNKYYNILATIFQSYFNQIQRNRVFFLKNYRRFLKYSNLNLSLSKYTQYLVKKFLRLNTTVCYPCVNSDYLLNLPKNKIKYDAINISRIIWYKRQSLFVKAANDLGLNIVVLGHHSDKTIKLDCPHFYYSDHEKTMEILNQSSFYVAPTIFEGFGMTSVEAAFLNKPIIASNIYVHRDILGDYPIYFKRDDINDLKSKMKITINLKTKSDNSKIIKRFSIYALKKRLIKIIESLN